jgi:GntR family transcriptional regulator
MPLVPTSLDLTIDRNSPIPLYFQMAQQFEAAIRSGQLPAGTRLDNEVQIALDLEVSRPTVRAAFLYLVNHGLVERKRGSGTVVIREKVNRTVQLSSLYDDLIAAGRTPVSRVLTNELVAANEVVAEALEIPLDSQVLVLARLRLVDDDPIALMRNYLPAEFAPLESSALETRGLYELLRAQGVRIVKASQKMSARNATAAEAHLLDEKRGAALLTMQRIGVAQSGRPVEFGEHVYRASRYVFQASLELGSAESPHSLQI